MAEKCLMYWVSKQKRWLKEYKGKTYSVSCKQLGCSPTKDISRKAANDWWEQKQRELDEALGAAKKHPAYIIDHYQAARENWRLFAKWHRRYGEPAQAEQAETFMDGLDAALKEDNPPYPLPPQQQKPLDLMEVLTEDWLIWQDRFRQIMREEQAETATPAENTIRAHLDDYLAVMKSQQKVGTYDTIKTRLNTFRSWVEPLAPIENLNEACWERFCVYLKTKSNLAAHTQAGTQRAVRAFIRNRWERRFIDLPRNLTSRILAASVPIQEVIIFSKEEIAQLITAASERTTLYILLALNCGFYGVDIAALRQDEVDWQAGRISRQRTKTRNRSKSVPKVSYMLWRQTFDLLKKNRSNHPDLVLLNENRKPLWSESEKHGKFNRNNNVKTAYFHLWEKKLKQTKGFKPFKTLRKTAASLLETHKDYGRYAEYFLGEAPSSIAGRHYIQPSTKRFDAALRWLGQQLGIEQLKRPKSKPNDEGERKIKNE